MWNLCVLIVRPSILVEVFGFDLLNSMSSSPEHQRYTCRLLLVVLLFASALSFGVPLSRPADPARKTECLVRLSPTALTGAFSENSIEWYRETVLE